MRSQELTVLASVVGIAVGLFPLAGSAAQESSKSQPRRVVEQMSAQQRMEEPRPTSTSTAPSAPVYKPPLRGAPGGRVSGGSRGSESAPRLWVLAPDHTGFTISEQPSVYWTISHPTSIPIEFTVAELGTGRPILETRLPGPVKPGVHRIDLADYGVRLSPDVQYQWFVAIVRDPDRRSKDILAGGTIQRCQIPEGFGARVAATDLAELPTVYATGGFWYDAVAAISERIEATPNDPALRSQRDALLRQVGLPYITE
jgi:uncharacterized protein DUF928